MTNNTKAGTAWLKGLLWSAAIATIALGAQARDPAPGYVVDSQGNVVRGGYGSCVHTGTWTPEMATIVGCDGVVLDVEAEVIEGEPTGIVASVVIPAATMFAFDSDVLTDEGKEAIESYRQEVRPELSQAYAVVVVGHTDSTGDPEYNLDLSRRRAESVRDYLVSTGAPADVMRVIGRGEKEPVASNETREGRALNRRVEVIVIGEARGLDVIRFPSVALFERRSAELTAQGRRLLDQNRRDAADKLKRASYIEVVGHTDDVGDEAYNMDLSLQRARAVRDLLIAGGVDPSKIVAVGLGESAPIATNKTPEGRAENRRVEVLVLGRLR